MRNFKKVIAAGLALLMLALSVNVSFASAEKYTAKEAEAVGKVNAAGIMTGTDKGFEPAKTLTRAEAAAIFVRMKGISEDTVKQNGGSTLFNDVAASHWAAGYINVASNYGIIKGVGAGKFAPEKEVSVAEFYTMAIRSLNAGQLVEAEGTWPTNYVNFAIENDLAENVAQIYTATSTRLTAAIIVANTLEAKIWNKAAYVNNGEITFTPGDKTTLDVLGLTEIAGGVTPGYVNAKDHIIDGVDVVETFDLSGIKAGIKYHAYKNSDGEITGLWIEDDSIEFTKIAKEYDSDDKVITLTVDGKDKEYKLSATTIKTIPNENSAEAARVLITDLDTEDEVEDLFGTITVNDKNEIVTMSTYQYTNYFIVDEVTKSTVKVDSKSVNGKLFAAKAVRYDVEDNDYSLTKDGKAIEFADLEEGDAVRYYTVEDFDGKEDHDKIVAEVISPVSGKITAKGADYIKIDGTKYKTVIDKDGNQLALGMDVNDEIDAYLNTAGKVVMYKVVEEDKENSAAIVTYLKPWTDKYSETNADVKLTFMDGTESEELTIDFEATYKEVKKSLAINSEDDTEVMCGDVKVGTVASGDDVDDFIDSLNTTAKKETVGKTYADAVVKLGQLISYKINGSKLTVVPATTDDFEKITADAIKVEKKSTALMNGTAKVAYINADTKVYNVVKDKDTKWTVKEVAVDDLDGTTSIDSDSVVYVVGKDDKTSEVDYVVIKNVDEKTKFKRTTETNFAYIKEVSETEYDDKDACEVTFIMMDGTEKTYIYCEDEADASYDFTAAGVVGTIVDLEVKDELVMKATNAVSSAADDKLIVATGLTTYVKDLLSDRLLLTTGEDIALGDETLVIRLKKDLKFKAVKDDLTAIDEFDEDLEAGENQDKVTTVYTYQDEDGETELVAVFYVEAEDQD